jgi:hypothetical protein
VTCAHCVRARACLGAASCCMFYLAAFTAFVTTGSSPTTLAKGPLRTPGSCCMWYLPQLPMRRLRTNQRTNRTGESDLRLRALWPANDHRLNVCARPNNPRTTSRCGSAMRSRTSRLPNCMLTAHPAEPAWMSFAQRCQIAEVCSTRQRKCWGVRTGDSSMSAVLGTTGVVARHSLISCVQRSRHRKDGQFVGSFSNSG